MNNINLHNPYWPDVIDNLSMSDRRISAALTELGVDYGAGSVNALRCARVKEPSYRVGVALVELLNLNRIAKGREPVVLGGSLTR